jgi:hypothetical protein
MQNVVLVFTSNAGTMMATKALRDSGIQARMIPKPANVQSASNLCLTVEHSSESRAVDVLTAARVSVSTIRP